MKFFALIAAVAVGVGLAGAAIGPVSAQNATAVGNQTAGEADAPPGFEYTLDEYTVINDWEYVDGAGEFEITFSVTDRPMSVWFTEGVSADESGVQTANILQKQYDEGTHTVRFSADPGQDNEATVVISTPLSVNQGRAAVISTGSQGRDPFAAFGGASGVFSGIGVSMLLSGLAAVFVVWREETGVIEA